MSAVGLAEFDVLGDFIVGLLIVFKEILTFLSTRFLTSLKEKLLL